MKKRRLTLNKTSIAQLNAQTQQDILGGGEQAFTSIFRCSKGGWTCADTCTANATYTCICTNTVPPPPPPPPPAL
ncbi:MAG TPA: class I lanthipeptide [Chitinophaga sp.]|uniref:class I lanthipeptide n=1 Tax=Chitinophaga sp. TaxID=1869181 RepID=UPI002CBFC6FF|nr:class I lanthipeptide [Chitinophaga sp.]HVI43843.1 class I lanthipeptide [Chitinophaga sp.]